MKSNQNGFAMFVGVLIVLSLAAIVVGAYFYFVNRNNVKSYDTDQSHYTDQGNMTVSGDLMEDGACNFQLDYDGGDGESNFAEFLDIPEFKNRCDEVKQYVGKKVEIRGHVFGQSFSEPCSCIPIGYIENVESFSLAQPDTQVPQINQ
ncbi:MAG: hypothetical protein L7H18_04635 [Candidatus Nealsonbacteria bacterium DGGOD1a]|jgi:hypothetical protein|nr:MAG: hypothetical protein L7H18_04635 [Candidatus Nealsonbacteria bacterium DGGOD1a]